MAGLKGEWPPLSNFTNALSDEIKSFLKLLCDSEITPVLIGGAVRDWLITGMLPSDLDFEIIGSTKKLEELINQVFGDGAKALPFGVFRVQCGDKELEFAPARKEVYQEGKSSYGHSDFEAELESGMDPQMSASRRDFTINAIGIEIKNHDDQWNFSPVDPYQGVQDLEMKLLRPINTDFTKDPVRLLRAIRFRELLGGDFSEDLKKYLSEFNLRELTSFYFLSEAFKTDFYAFLSSFFHICDENGIDFPKELSAFRSLLNWNGPQYLSRDSCHLFMTICFHFEGKDEKNLIEIGNLLNLKKKSIHGVLHLSKIQKSLMQIELGEAKSFVHNKKAQEILRLKRSLETLENNGLSFKTWHQETGFGEHFIILLGPYRGGDEYKEVLEKETWKDQDKGLLKLYFHLKTWKNQND